MDDADSGLALAIIIVIGVVLIILARWSRNRWEKEQGKVKITEKIRALAIFLSWCAVFVGLIMVRPAVYLILLFVLTLGVLPVGRENKGIIKDIVDMGFLGVLVVGPFALVYHSG